MSSEAVRVVGEQEPQGATGNSPPADGPDGDSPVAEPKEKGHPIRKAVTLLATGAAAAFALKWRRRQETVFGLAVGLVVGIRIRRKYRRNRDKREQMQELLSTNWDHLMGKKGITSFAYWNRNTAKESLCWLNTLIKLMWPYYNEAISNTVVSVVEKIIQEKKPGFLNDIAFERFTLGEVPIELNNLRMAKKKWKRTVENGLEFVAEMRWHGDVNIVLAVQGLVQESRSLCKVKIGRLLISGPLRVRMKPFVPIIPCFGSIGVSFVCPPDVDFDLKMTGALALTNPITNWLRPLIRNIITDKLVAPQQVIIPLMGPEKVPRSLIFPGRKGILRVRFKRAEGLRLTDIGGTCDPYIKAYTNKQDSYMSKIKSQTTEPVWDEEAVFIITDESQCVFLVLKDSDNSLVDHGDDLLGRAKIGPLDDIQGLLNKGKLVEHTLELGLGDWFTKQADGSRGPGTGAGRIFLDLQYTTLKELKKVPGDRMPTDGPPQVQSGILFCHLKRALNVGEGGVKAKLSLVGDKNYESEFSEAKLEEEPQKQEVQEQEQDIVSSSEGEAVIWRSSAAWQTQFGFVNIEADKTLRVELFKKKGLGAKPIGWVELPVALPATPGGPEMLSSVYALQGLPEFGQDPTYQGAAVELGLEWVPVDTNVVPDMETMFKSMGVLKIRLCNARGLPQTDLVGDTDPYVVFQIGANRRFKSSTKQDNRSPEWMEEFTFIRVDQDETVMVSMFDEGPVRDEPVGNVAIPVAAVRSSEGGRLSGVWLLQSAKKGSICMDLVWLPYSHDFRPFLDSGLPAVGAPTDNEAPLWPAEPAENEIVPPFALDMRKVDVEVELRRVVVAPDPVKETPSVKGNTGSSSPPMHLKTHMVIQGVNHTSKDFLGDGTPLKIEPFRWSSVPQFATLDVTVCASGKSGEEIGSFSIELRDALLSEDGSREMRFDLPAADGHMELVISVTPDESKKLCGSCLNVVLEKGTGLRAADAGGKSDPHCYLRVRDQVFKSTTKFSTLEPRWMEHFQFVDVEPHEVLELQVMDADRTAGKDDLGHVVLPLRGVFEAPGLKLQKTLPLQGPKAEGELSLKLFWVSNPMATLSSMEPPPNSHMISVASADDILQQQPRAAPAISIKGRLKVTLHWASDLAQPEGLFATSMDCYVKFMMSGQLGSEKSAEEFRSSVAKNSVNPSWVGEEFVFKEAEADDMLTVRLTEKKLLGKNVLGHVIIPLREVQDAPGGSLRKSWPCGGESGGLAGTINLSLEFTPIS